jgi:hypothetical protein
MKTQKVLLVTLISGMIFSCNKDQVSDQPVSGANSNSDSVQRIAPEHLESSYNDFITETMDDAPEYISYEVQDALLVLEAALNYHYGEPTEDYIMLAIDSSTFTWRIDKDQSEEFMLLSQYVSGEWNELFDYFEESPSRTDFGESGSEIIVYVNLEFPDLRIDSTQTTQNVTVKGYACVGFYPEETPSACCMLPMEKSGIKVGCCEYCPDDDWIATSFGGQQGG